MSLLDTASLIVTPNGYKEGTLYSVIPSDGSGDMSVVRATTATRVNSAGLVELVPYNLASYSEQFDNAYWSQGNSSITTNAITAPNGTLTADKIVENSSSSGHYVETLIYTSVGQTHTISIHLKKGERNFGYVGAYTNESKIVFVNLTTGAITNTVGTITNSSVETLDNGWFRVSFSFTAIAAVYPFLGPSNDGANFSYTGDGTSGIYLWGAQLNEATIKDYQKTETRLNIPRLDYSNGTCPSLLVEPQRTNLLTYSSSFDNSGAWGAIDTTITANTTISPSGNTDAETMAITSSTSRIFQTLALGAGTYTASIYVKSLSGTPTIQFRMVVDGTDITQSIPTTTDWVRHDFTFTASVAVSFFVIRGESGTGNVAIWGSQLEAGSYPTSYIPTTSASVTRNADVVSKTGISSLIGQTEGTILIDFDFNGKYGDFGIMPISVDGGGGSEVYVLILPNGALICEMYNAGANQFTFVGSIGAIGRKKIVIGYKQNDCVLYLNGTQIGTDTSATIPAMDRMFLGRFYASTSYNLSGGINASALWKTRLTNTQLQTLTSI